MSDQPTIVLVHGAFAESASWNNVISSLQSSGHRTIAAANPIRSLSGDSAFLKSLLAAIDGPAVLVGHSYGGSVMSNAAVDYPNIKALVFVAAFAPVEGESIADLSGKFPGSTLGETLWTVPLSDGTTDLYIRQDRYHKQFAGDLSAEDAALAAAGQRPLCDAALNEGATAPAWKTLPSWFIWPELDYNIPPAVHRFMAERAGAREAIEVAGASHSLPVSHPDEVSAMIVRAVAAVS